MPSGSSFEADLRAIRDAKGLTLDEIQHDTRIPVDVLRRFEEGNLVGDPTYNPVYLKAFLTSYAKAVGTPVATVLAAYEAQVAGRYDGSLNPAYEPGKAPSAAPPSSEAAAGPEAVAVPDTPEEAPPPPTRAPGIPAVEALASAPSPEAARAAADPPKTLAQARVSRPAVPTARRSFDKNWGTILGLFAVLAVALGAALWYLVFRDADGPEANDPDTVAVGGSTAAAIDSSGIGAGAASGGPQFRMPIEVTVTAGGDGLQWFRVTEDRGDRLPHWIDLGASQTFSADSALVLWGEGNEAGPALAFEESIVEIQGQRFTPPNGTSLTISAATGQRLLDSLAASRPPAPAGTE